MKIGIDIDNVISNTFQDLSEYFNQFMGKNAEAHEVVDIMRKEKLKMWAYWFASWRLKKMITVTPMDGAPQTIRDWHDKHEIHLVTSRIPLFNRQTKSWLMAHDIPYHKLHHAKEKTKHKKAPGCNVFIEDNLDECEILAEFCEKVFLMDHPWNRRQIRQKNIIRVSCWKEIRDQLK